MKWQFYKVISFTLAAAFILSGFGGTEAKQIEAEVTYISSEAIYINAGTDYGLAVGDSLAVVRSGNKMGWLKITNVSSKSSAAVLLSAEAAIRVGDYVAIEYEIVAEPAAADSARPIPNESIKRDKKSNENQLRGTVTIEQVAYQDQSGSQRNWYQSGLGLRLRMDNIGGHGINFAMRHRTRLYHRSKPTRIDQSQNQWTHRLSEFSFTSNNDRRQWGVGRVVPPQVRGMGYIDGAYLVRPVSERWSAGAAVGTSPSYTDSGFDFDRRKAGLFVAYEIGQYDTRRLALSAALSTEYRVNTVSRDFLYFQSDFSSSRKLYLFQSAEIDINRSWRYASSQERLKLTNYFGSARLQVRNNLGIRFSYDSRSAIRYFESREIADSLFDDRSRRGLRGGVDWSASKLLRITADAGIRLRSDINGDSRNASLAVRLKGFPKSLQSLFLRLSWVETEFLTAYRPYASYQLRAFKKWNLNLSASGYLYETTGQIEDNYTFAAEASRYFGNRYYFTLQVRQYLDSYLQSTELRTELGISL